MDDFNQQFRRFLHLDRKRKGGGLTPHELRRWLQLKRVLNREFTPGSDPKGIQRRESVRVPARMAVSFRNLGDLRECLMTNLSRGGLFIATDSPLEMGTRFHLRIEMEKTRETIEVPGGTFDCERFSWWTSFDQELRIWRTGPHNMLVQLEVLEENRHVLYRLATLSETEIAVS